MACPYCIDVHYSPSYLPSTKFNNKLFHYLKCSNCDVVYISPFPDANDYIKMYPPGYQSGVDKTILKNKYKKLPGLRFSYGVQFDLILKHAIKNPKILDYGCGNANFLINACNNNFQCDGVEFSEEHVEILKSEIPSSKFYIITNFIKNSDDKYDVIRLSNVLEHMDNPNEIIQSLIMKLNKNGMLLIEGPIECNFSLAFLSRKLYFKFMNLIRKGYVANHVPTHITFTNAKNQLSFFQKFGLTTLEYKIIEAEWPYPEKFSDVKSLGAFSKWVIAKKSKLISHFVKNWGNTFIYVGKNNSDLV
jgi:2-polyprenyl-3-methyl-5-hydroxy-6-metoxy-1,4-benzoquinol methylase